MMVMRKTIHGVINMEKITKKNVDKFCEDNFLDESLEDLMQEVAKMIDARAEVKDKGKETAILKIEVALKEM